MKKIFLSTLLAIVLCGCVGAYAQEKAGPVQKGATQAPPAQQSAGTQVTNPSYQASGFLLSVKLKNPLKVSTVEGAVSFFVNTLLKLAIPFIVLFFLWSGFKFITAQGNPTEIGKAKNMFWYTIIGTLLILGAWAITNAIIGTINTIVN